MLSGTRKPATGTGVLVFNTAASVLMVAGLGAAYLAFGSRLALAQAADSLSDVLTASALLLSVRVAAIPADESHPLGHHGAEPIAALLAAVAAGILAVEVFRSAVEAIVAGARPDLGWVLVGAFGAKVVVKTGVAFVAGRHHRATSSPAMRALAVDARNDVLVGGLSVLGFFAARFGSSGWDAWLALPVAAWIGWSGIGLARENVALLMGAAPDPARREELMRLACEVAGVESVHGLHARYHGATLDVLVHVVVDAELTVRQAHDIGHAVEARLVAEPDVEHAVAHVDVEHDEPETEALEV